MMLLFPGDIIIIPLMLIIGMVAQSRVKSAYAKYSQVQSRSGLTGADVARMIMDREGIRDVGLEIVPGEMSDHYDPRSKTVRLSPDVYHGHSVAALGIAAHECGHVVQHARSYAPLALRGFMYPVSSIGSSLAVPLVLGGVFFGLRPLIPVGIMLYIAAVVFTLVTLPVEFNASSRAKKALAASGYLDQEELDGVRTVLNAAAMTYVAAALSAILMLIRLLLIARNQ